jgi:hypothetical protein
MRTILLDSAPLLLDGRSDVAAAFSLRRIRRNYSGPLIRVRRSSDSAERDFGSGAALINLDQVAAFYGGGSGFIAKWYDQSGNGRDLLQATGSLQPQAILASNGLPAAYFNAFTTANSMATAASFTLNQPWSFNLCYRRVRTVEPSFENIFDGWTADSGTLFNRIGSNPAGTNAMYAGGFGPENDSASMPTGSRGVVGGSFNGASSVMEINAATLASFTGNPGTGNPGGLTLGCRADGNTFRFADIEVQEWVVFNAAHATTQLKADNAVIRASWRF